MNPSTVPLPSFFHVLFFIFFKKKVENAGSTLRFISPHFPNHPFSTVPSPADRLPPNGRHRPALSDHRRPPISTRDQADRRPQTNGAHDPSPSLPTDSVPARLSLGPATSDLVFTQKSFSPSPSSAAIRRPQTARTTVAHDHADQPEQAAVPEYLYAARGRIIAWKKRLTAAWLVEA